ncbi:hypothetical protein DCAR_0208293 [Daucus carota subsp. sativus]|uniref:Uncharacterized protein n=1 Tax=Daucus carota subsp. sativus TaxID=79200 RepID=A0A166EFY0_DAUCS|nr:hypothetical protein DCAR_0208293 [Daucus carota subsp. sativus]
MAAITTCTSTALISRVSIVQKAPTVLGLPVMPRVGKVKCLIVKDIGGGASTGSMIARYHIYIQ